MNKADELLIRIFKATYPEYFTPNRKMIKVDRTVELDDCLIQDIGNYIQGKHTDYFNIKRIEFKDRQTNKVPDPPKEPKGPEPYWTNK